MTMFPDTIQEGEEVPSSQVHFLQSKFEFGAILVEYVHDRLEHDTVHVYRVDL